jgi:predicted phosphodiesterase
MKIQIWSDLHNEFSVFCPPSNSSDLVILAGDIDIKSRGVKWANETFDCPVIYVCGNHEFYGGHIDRTLKKMRDAAASHVHILENDVFVWQQIRFLGTTAWTDFTSTGDVVAAARTAATRMNDFQVIRTDANWRRIRPDDIVKRNQVARAWLLEELAKPFLGTTIVVTHHCPTPAVAVDDHEGHLGAAYSNHWPDLIEQADLWIFGHTHSTVDTHLAGCRLISNPRGYSSEHTGFDSSLEIEV